MDILNKQFNNLHIISYKPHTIRYVVCKCICGKTKTIKKSDVIRGTTKSCGCGGITPKVIRSIIVDYTENKIAIHKLTKQYKLSEPTISKILHNNGTKVGLPTAKIKWNFDNTFFFKKNKITAYWAGFLMADGNFHKVKNSNRKKLNLTIAIKDVDHLHQYCNDLNVSTDVIQYVNKEKTQDTCGVTLSLRHIKNIDSTLSRWGIVERKTYNFVEPKIPLSLLPHYIRGWIDGDGCIISKGSQKLKLVGNKEAMQWCLEKLKEIGFTNNIQYRANEKDAYGVIYICGRKNIAKITKLLQVKNNRRLARKWKDALDWEYMLDNNLFKR